MTRICFTDTETFSEVPISAGTDLYTRAAECMIVTYAIDEAPTKIWQPWEPCGDDMPLDLQECIADPATLFVAHKAEFDFNIYERALRIETDRRRWRCTMAQAYAHGLPGSIETLGAVLGLPIDQQKLVDDKALIHTFCERQKSGRRIWPTDAPVEWERFCRYAIRDTDALREIYRRLPKHNYLGLNLRWWYLNQLENERGFGFDAPLANDTREFLRLAKAQTDLVISGATGGAVRAATQRAKLLAYLQNKYGLGITNLRASEVRDWLESDDLHPEVRFLLETRLEASKSSGSKYTRGLNTVGPGSRIRWAIQWSGAGRTGRNSGRGFQPHNMPRPMVNVRQESGPKKGQVLLVPVKAKWIDDVILPGIRNHDALSCDIVYGGPHEAAALALRHVITAAPNNELTVADWKNIESRVLAWIAGEAWKIAAYEANDRGEGADLYKLLFSQFFGTDIATVNDTERQAGKVCELAFGFGGGVGALVTMAATYQIDLEPLADIVLPRASKERLAKAERAWRRAFLENNDYDLEADIYMACDILKQGYRESNERIDQLKNDLGDAVKKAVRMPGAEGASLVGKCKVWSTKSALMIELPSGRRLTYWSPRIEYGVRIDPETGYAMETEFITYWTARGKQWRKESSWPGLFVENIVQAIANDVLRWSAVSVHDDALTMPAVVEYLATLPKWERTPLAMDVHDELALDLPTGMYPGERLAAQCTKGFTWSVGLPLAVDWWVYPRYGKREQKHA